MLQRVAVHVTACSCIQAVTIYDYISRARTVAKDKKYIIYIYKYIGVYPLIEGLYLSVYETIKTTSKQIL